MQSFLGDKAKAFFHHRTRFPRHHKADFRVGGVDLFRCGSKSDPKYHGEARYVEIKPERLIVYAETIDADGARLSASLNTIELFSSGKSTRLNLTVQIAAFEGRDMVDGTRFGHNHALDNLQKFLCLPMT